MTSVLIVVLASLRAATRSRLELAAEILGLRHQLAVLQRTSASRPRLRPIDRLLWMVLSTVWTNWWQAVQNRHSRHRGAVASARVRRLLALEFATASRRPAASGL
jgi:hypothetical protein